MNRRIGGLVAAGIVQLVALVLAHDLVFLARYGSKYNEELVHVGHGGTWAAAVQTTLALGALLAAAGIFRLVRLRLHLRGRTTSAARPGSLPVRSLLAGWFRAALLLAPTTAALLTIQENVERWAIGQRFPGPGVLLTPEYAGGLWIALLVAVAVALVVALFRWRRETLLARLRAAQRRPARAAADQTRHTGIEVQPPAESLLGRRSALRAPPAVSAS
ncbi:MAG TPA: hypothetical protein VE011_04765 [Candidatus Dormibacteraeota bacterium]|nr:hypothetical protein [Candidatus Dormibacteraeota bacterium]